MKIASIPEILAFNPFESESQSQHNLGEAVISSDRRVFRIGKAASTSAVGKLQQAPTPNTNHHNRAVAAAVALGGTVVTVTLGATAAVADEYAEGYMVGNDAVGEGRVYQISGHLAVLSSGVISLNLFDPISGVALTTASEVTLVHNTYRLFQEAAVSTLRPAGVPLKTAAAAGDFLWLQTKGVAAVLCGTTRTLGANQISSGATAGAVVDATDVLGASAEVQVGVADVAAGVDTEYNPMTLFID